MPKEGLILDATTDSKKTSLLDVDTIAVLIALILLSIPAVLTRLSEQEISPISAVFNRLWMAAIALGIWSYMPITITGHHNAEAEASSIREKSPLIFSLIFASGLGASHFCRNS